jgi:hypothetical protein
MVVKLSFCRRGADPRKKEPRVISVIHQMSAVGLARARYTIAILECPNIILFDFRPSLQTCTTQNMRSDRKKTKVKFRPFIVG